MNDIRRSIEQTIILRARETAKNIAAVNALANVLKGVKPRPLTRREKMARFVNDWRYRVVTAWRVLRGDDIHDECGY